MDNLQAGSVLGRRCRWECCLASIARQTVSAVLCESLNGPNGNNQAEQQYCAPCYATEGSFDYRYYVLALLALLPTPASEHPASPTSTGTTHSIGFASASNNGTVRQDAIRSIVIHDRIYQLAHTLSGTPRRASPNNNTAVPMRPPLLDTGRGTLSDKPDTVPDTLI